MRPFIFLFLFSVFAPFFSAAQHSIELPANYSFKQKLILLDSLIKKEGKNDTEYAMDLLKTKLKIATEEKNDSVRAISYFNIGKRYAKRSLFKYAINYYDSSFIIFKKINLEYLLVDIYTAIGSINMAQGLYDSAADNYVKGLRLADKFNDRDQIAVLNCNLANIFYFQGKYDEALRYYSEGYMTFKELGHQVNMALTLDNMAIIYLAKKDFKNAVDKHYQALELLLPSKDYSRIASLYINLASTYKEWGNFEKALYYYQEAEKIHSQLNDKYLLAVTYLNLGDVHTKMGSFKKAEAILLKSYDYSKEIGSYDVVKGAVKNLSELYEKQGQHHMALKFYKEYSQYKDSVTNKEVANKINEINTKYESEKKEKEIELLTKDNELNSERLAKKNAQNIYLIVGLVMLGLLLFSFIYRFNEKKKANSLLEERNTAIQHQKKLIEEKQTEILDSINYAKRIQYTLLAHDEFLKTHLPEHFVLFNPKDIVSGDFYWATSVSSPVGNRFYLAVCDSTGHGVPGAFMSLLNISFLNEAITEKAISDPGKVFDFVRERLIHHVSREGQKDGFDGVLLCFEKEDLNNGKINLSYAAANNSPLLVQNGEIRDMAKDRYPVGFGENLHPFTTFKCEINKGDMLYVFTDGFADQFGGPKGKKFMQKQLSKTLQLLSPNDLNSQKARLSETFNDWKGKLEQVDDVCVIGIRFCNGNSLNLRCDSF